MDLKGWTVIRSKKIIHQQRKMGFKIHGVVLPTQIFLNLFVFKRGTD